MERSLAHRAVAKEELGDVVGLLVAHRVGHPDAQRYVAADDAIAAHHAVLHIEEVHGTALAFYETGALAVEFGHHLFRVAAQ